jgi:hypothetical protein
VFACLCVCVCVFCFLSLVSIPFLVTHITKDLQMRIIHLLLGEYFFIHQIFVEPSDVMHDGVSRRRTYVYMLNKERGVYLHDVYEMYEEVKHKLKKICKTKPSDYLVSTPTQKALDAMALAASRKITYDPEHWLHMIIKLICVELLFC